MKWFSIGFALVFVSAVLSAQVPDVAIPGLLQAGSMRSMTDLFIPNVHTPPEYHGIQLTGTTGGIGNLAQGMSTTEYNVNPSGRLNFVSRMGYNPFDTPGQHSYYVTTESFFQPTGIGSGLTEWHIEYISPNRAVILRPLSIAVGVEGGGLNFIQWSAKSGAGGFKFFNQTSDTSPVAMVGGGDMTLQCGGASVGCKGVISTRGNPGFPMTFEMQPTTNRTFLNANQIAGGTTFEILSNKLAGDVVIVWGNAATPIFKVDANGQIKSEDLKNTGAAGGKKVVCVDTATGLLYASSTGTDCSN